MDKIKMAVPIVEMDGDEMTRVIWQMIKDELLYPYIDLNTEYYDLGLSHRDETGDLVTYEAAEAIKKHRVGVKCATITPNAQRVHEYNLHEMWKSPNGTIRAVLDGTVFRVPITTRCVVPAVRNWEKPITIARHAYGDVYKAAEYRVMGKGRAELLFTGEDGEKFRQTVYDFECPGVLQGMYNKDSSIESFARSCFEYALSNKQDLWFSAKDTIAKHYDGDFRDIFNRMYNKEYKTKLEKIGTSYSYTLIDDAVARAIRSEGGFVWALKNYDGDVMSDMVASAFGSLAMMTSVLCSPDGCFEYEAAHGTVTRHWYRYRNGEMTSTNPVATIFAWTGALRKRGFLDANDALIDFAGRLESACINTIESGVMTKDLAALCSAVVREAPDTLGFIRAVRDRLEK